MKVNFPAEFKQLVIKYNCGSPPPNSFDTAELTGKSFGELLNFNLESTSNIVEHYSGIKDKLPEGVISITCTPGGDYLCYDFRKDKGQPEVVHWDHNQIYVIDEDELIIPDHQN